MHTGYYGRVDSLSKQGFLMDGRDRAARHQGSHTRHFHARWRERYRPVRCRLSRRGSGHSRLRRIPGDALTAKRAGVALEWDRTLRKWQEDREVDWQSSPPSLATRPLLRRKKEDLSTWSRLFFWTVTSCHRHHLMLLYRNPRNFIQKSLTFPFLSCITLFILRSM